jgi:hypothetical protein
MAVGYKRTSAKLQNRKRYITPPHNWCEDNKSETPNYRVASATTDLSIYDKPSVCGKGDRQELTK